MQKGLYKVLSNIPLTSNVFKMVIESEEPVNVSCGQFINIKLEGLYLRRPISICDFSSNTITIIYKVVGTGTEALSKVKEGEDLDCLIGLGTGYVTTYTENNALVLGGGVGIPPLYGLCKKLVEEGKKVRVVLGFNTKEEIFFEEEFKKLGVETVVTTVDGSYGVKGFVTDAMEFDYDYFYTCGPLPMLKSVYNKTTTSGQFSFEERMGCGFGACMGCSQKTTTGYKRVCKEGPVFYKEEIVWEK
ncbi:MAG: dihydroorotate dehydrogenase electron transfer subunit [Bacilli bacterium]|nr:dihydroorotate dehydrogenase electron transfer subunit [Bacilli bacterium]